MSVGQQFGRRLTDQGTWAHAAEHLLGFLPILIVLAATGRLPLPAIALTIPLGPALLGRLLGSGPVIDRHRKSATAAAVTMSIAYLLIFGGLQLGRVTPFLFMLIPVFGLAIPLLTIAWLSLALSAASRAKRGLLMTYPFVIPFVRALEGE